MAGRKSSLENGPEPIDILIGSRVRILRLSRGLSQETLGERIGVTFQQIQKYERGANRVPGSRLSRIAAVLDVPVALLFGDPENADNTHMAAFPMIRDRKSLCLLKAIEQLPDVYKSELLSFCEVVSAQTARERALNEARDAQCFTLYSYVYGDDLSAGARRFYGTLESARQDLVDLRQVLASEPGRREALRDMTIVRLRTIPVTTETLVDLFNDLDGSLGGFFTSREAVEVINEPQVAASA